MQRKVTLSALLAALFLTLLPAQAEVTWDQVTKKINSAKDYQVKYKYDGPSGKFDFDYRWSPDKIRTEITDSKSEPSRRGTVIVYDKAWAADKVRAKTGGGSIVRNLTHKDVVGRPFHQSLFGMILSETAKLGKPTVSASGKDTKFTFKSPSGDYAVWTNANAEIIKTETTKDRVKEIRQLSSLKWNSSPDFGF